MKAPDLDKSVKILLLIILSATIIYFAADFLIPIVLAGILAMLMNPLCLRLNERGVPLGISSLICTLVLVAIVVLISFFLSWQISAFINDTEIMFRKLVEIARHTMNSIGIPESIQKDIFEKSKDTGIENIGGVATSTASSVLTVFINAVLVLVYLFLFLYFREHLTKFVLMLAPNSEINDTKKVIDEISKVAGQYLTGLGIMISMLWIMYSIGFSLIGVKNAIFFAILCGLLEIVPFVGNITGTSLTVLMVISQGGSEAMVLLVIATYLVIQFIQTYILEPLFVGSEVNINPLFTIIALIAGELLWGVPGMILAIPVLGIVKVICDHVTPLKPYGFLIGGVKRKKRTLLQNFVRKIKPEAKVKI